MGRWTWFWKCNELKFDVLDITATHDNQYLFKAKQQRKRKWYRDCWYNFKKNADYNLITRALNLKWQTAWIFLKIINVLYVSINQCSSKQNTIIIHIFRLFFFTKMYHKQKAIINKQTSWQILLLSQRAHRKMYLHLAQVSHR